MNKNQKNNQVENQVDNQLEKNNTKLDFNFLSENGQNLSCRIFQEQFDLINELPEEDRPKVLYLAVYNAFLKASKKNQDNQVENQVDLPYISVSVSVSDSESESVREYVSYSLTSIYENLSKISKSVLNLLTKTVECKNFNSRHGGKRTGSGRPRKTQSLTEQKNETQELVEPKIKKPTCAEIISYTSSLCKKIDVDDFMAYYEASNWLDKDGLPINWKQKAIQWAKRTTSPPKNEERIDYGTVPYNAFA